MEFPFNQVESVFMCILRFSFMHQCNLLVSCSVAKRREPYYCNMRLISFPQPSGWPIVKYPSPMKPFKYEDIVLLLGRLTSSLVFRKITSAWIFCKGMKVCSSFMWRFILYKKTQTEMSCPPLYCKTSTSLPLLGYISNPN